MRLEVFVLGAFIGILGNVVSCPNDKLCLQCGEGQNKRSCKKCYNSFFDFTTSSCNSNIQFKVDNCIEYEKKDDKLICKRCQEGSYPDNGITCKACAVAGCAKCDSNSCYACSNGVSIDFDKQICNPQKGVQIKIAKYVQKRNPKNVESVILDIR